MVARPGFERLVAWLCAGEVGAVLCFDASGPLVTALPTESSAQDQELFCPAEQAITNGGKPKRTGWIGCSLNRSPAFLNP
jgi:hypothetical protein